MSSGEAAGLSAGNVLLTPNLGDPGLEMIAGPIEVVAAPFVALVSAVRAKHDRLPVEKMSRAEADLAAALAEMARQEHFTHAFKAIVNTVPVVKPGQDGSPDALPTGLVIEPQVNELRLLRVGRGDNCRLTIQAGARLLRRADGAVIAERLADYRSDEALFIDWTRKDAVEGVARTGYNAIAQKLTAELLATRQPSVIQLGAGFGKGAYSPRLNFADVGSSEPGLLRVSASDEIGVYSDAALLHPTVPRPMVREEVISEAQEATSWALDGMDDHPNSVVQLGACIVAIPLGLSKQIAAIFAPGRNQVDRAEAVLRAAALETKPHEAVATELALHLAPDTAQRVYVVHHARPTADMGARMVTTRVDGKSLTCVPVSYSAGGPPPGSRTGLAIRAAILKTTLAVGEGLKPKLTLELEAEIRVVNSRGNETLASVPVHYRSASRKYKQWAANNAHLFKEELDKAYKEIAAAAADQILLRGIITPGGPSLAVLANERS